MESSLADETTEHDRSPVMEWWLELDSGWQATVFGLVIIVCSLAMRLF